MSDLVKIKELISQNVPLNRLSKSELIKMLALIYVKVKDTCDD